MPITYAPGAEPTPLPVMPEIPTDGSVHIILLNRTLYAIIDIADKPLIEGWRFRAECNPDGYWYVRGQYGNKRDGSYKRSMLHTILTGYVETDHKDGNTFNARRSNLRESNSSQNKINQSITIRNASGYKGVSWFIRDSKWRAEIRINARKTHLGMFNDKIDAALAYDMAAREYHGQFATLNFPIIGERSAITGEIRPIDLSQYPEYERKVSSAP